MCELCKRYDVITMEYRAVDLIELQAVKIELCDACLEDAKHDAGWGLADISRGR